MPSISTRTDQGRTGALLDVGKSVQPFVTPDDPDAFEAALREHGVEVTDGGASPFV